MKKLKTHYQDVLAHRSRRVMRRRQARNGTQLGVRYAVWSDNEGRRLVKIREGLRVPNVLCLDTNIIETLDYFDNLRRKTLQKRKFARPNLSRNKAKIHLIRNYSNFVNIKHVSPGAALILAAEYDRIRRTSQSPAAVIDVDQWDDTVYNTFRELGFFDLLGFNASLRATADGSTDGRATSIMRMACGNDTDLSDAGDGLLSLFSVVGGDNQARVALLGAVADAIENVRGHAYENVRHPGIPQLWWLSGSADPATRKLTLSIYDQGITIPVTLPNKWSPSLIATMLSSLSVGNLDLADPRFDGIAVQAAMRLSQTSTDARERGKGLTKIRDAVARCEGGKLRVLSRYGNYLFENGVERAEATTAPLRGTFIGLEATFAASGRDE